MALMQFMSTPSPPETYDAATAAATRRRVVVQRAAKACQRCRDRKVRCDVVYCGIPCTNCAFECYACSLPARRDRVRKPRSKSTTVRPPEPAAERTVGTTYHVSSDTSMDLEHVLSLEEGPGLPSLRPLAAKQNSPVIVRPLEFGSAAPFNLDTASNREAIPPTDTSPPASEVWDRGFLKEAPSSIKPSIIRFLDAEGALDLPSYQVTRHLLQSYIEHTHPRLPVIDLHETVAILSNPDGSQGQISLFLFQAMMLAGAAYVDLVHLRAAGFRDRATASDAYFERCKLLYNLEYEEDKFTQVQALTLMTTHYSGSDDSKDLWYWMDLTLSNASSIHLNQDPEPLGFDVPTQKLRRRLWWSIYMRAQLISLAFHLPPRWLPGRNDLELLSRTDFDLKALPTSAIIVSDTCTVARDVDKLTILADMCIETLKLTTCIQSMMEKQYAYADDPNLLGTQKKVRAYLVPKSDRDKSNTANSISLMLHSALAEIPLPMRESTVSMGDDVLDVHRCIYHLLFWTIMANVHRPSAMVKRPQPGSTPDTDTENACAESRKMVRGAARRITAIGVAMARRDLHLFLPTTGVTALLAACFAYVMEPEFLSSLDGESAANLFCRTLTVLDATREQLGMAAATGVALMEATLRRVGVDTTPTRAPNAAAANKSELITVGAVPLNYGVSAEDLVSALHRRVQNHNSPNSVAAGPAAAAGPLSPAKTPGSKSQGPVSSGSPAEQFDMFSHSGLDLGDTSFLDSTWSPSTTLHNQHSNPSNGDNHPPLPGRTPTEWDFWVDIDAMEISLPG